MKIFPDIRGRMRRLMDYEPNPVLVRELRRTVRNRFCLWIMTVLAIVLFIFTVFFLVFDDGISRGSASGRDFLKSVWAILLFSLYGVGLSVFNLHLAASDSGSMDMLYATTLKPNKIVRGRLLAGLSFAFMILSVGMPFIVLSYQLRGVDFYNIAGSLCILAMVALILNSAAVLVSTFSIGNPLKYVVFLLLAGITLPIVFSMIDHRGFAEFFSNDGFIFMVLLVVGISYISYTVSVFFVSPYVSNRTFRFRITLIVLLILAYLVPFLVETYYGYISFSSYHGYSLTHGYFFSSEATFTVIGSLVIMFAQQTINLFSPDNWSQRILGEIPRQRYLRFLSLFLCNHKLSGMLWTLSVGIILWLVFYLIGSITTTSHDLGFKWASSAWFVMLLYLLAYELMTFKLTTLLARFGYGHRYNAYLVFVLLVGAVTVSSWVSSLAMCKLGLFGLDKDMLPGYENMPMIGDFFSMFSSEQIRDYYLWHLEVSLFLFLFAILINRRWIVKSLEEFFNNDAASAKSDMLKD